MDYLNQAVRMNNNAVRSLMTAGPENYVISVLNDSLSIMTGQLCVKEHHTTCHNKEISHDIRMVTREPNVSNIFHVAMDLSSLPSECGFIYNQALIISEAASQSLEEEDIRIYSACIILNCAIVHHRKGILVGLSVYLEVAARLYEAALELLSGFSMRNSSGTSLLIIAGALNNLSQIHLELGNFEAAKQRASSLADLLLKVEKTNFEKTFTAQEWDGILVNLIMFLKCPYVAAAA
jgi:hypothetical protein